MKNNFIDYLFYGFIYVVLAGLLFFLIDCFLGTDIQVEGIVIEKMYSPSKTSVGVGTGVTTGGKVGTGTIVTSEGEKYVVILEIDKYDIVESYSITAKDWSELKIGSYVSINQRTGLISGWWY